MAKPLWAFAVMVMFMGRAPMYASEKPASTQPAESRRTSIGINLVQIPAGSFMMGSESGDYDEKPVHVVKITQPFWMSQTEITNAQYEQFDPSHQKLRGKDGISKNDDEAVIFVSWNDAKKFCDWLSEKEGVPYRLPTEAEWEYACRAGTTTAYNTGDTLPAAYCKRQKKVWRPDPSPLYVGKTSANAWGLYDMHGNVEEWCGDWYGPYEALPAVDPVGRTTGEFRVTRGGSYNTDVKYLRSANRSGDVPDDRNWLIGFRVVQAPLPKTASLPPQPPAPWAENVSQGKWDWKAHVSQGAYFQTPIPYVLIPPGSNGPLFSKHNHCPSIAACPNGDLLVTWYTCNDEASRQLAVCASRLRPGASAWEPASIFYKAPDRNMHATAIWWDGNQTLYHFNGLSVSYGWESLALLFRTSTDNGVTWSQPRWINPEHGLRNMPIAGVFRTSRGAIILPCDAVPGGEGGSAIHVSFDQGKTWVDPGLHTKPLRPKYSQPGAKGGSIAGIHAKVVELMDGRLMAFGRGDSIDGHMPMSFSSDQGKTWTYAASPFPPIVGGQRLVLMRLQEGPLLLVSFTSRDGMDFIDRRGKSFKGHGMFAALSMDDGKTWPLRKLLTPGKGRFNGQGWTGEFKTDGTHAEPSGYLAATQSPDHAVHLVSSGLYYRFNLKWLQQPNDPPTP